MSSRRKKMNKLKKKEKDNYNYYINRRNKKD